MVLAALQTLRQALCREDFGEKCNVDLFESFHKGNELGISCEIDLKTA